jgi:recombination protein RecA
MAKHEQPLPSLSEWGKVWNTKTKRSATFDPEDDDLIPEALSTEIPALDAMLGGGFCRGRTTTIFGEPSSGKTLLSQLLIAAAQRQGGRAMFFDVERTYDPRWFRMTGVDTDYEKLIVVRPANLEQSFDMLSDALVKVKPDVIVVDSIPAMVPKAILDADMEKQDFRGVHARKITEGMGQCTQDNTNTVLVFINQTRIAMNVRFGSPESLPGGKGIRFYSSVLLRTRRGTWLYDSGEGTDMDEWEEDTEKPKIGFTLKLRAEKNKLAPPGSTIPRVCLRLQVRWYG